MPDWTTFAGFTGVVLGALLLLAHLSKGFVGGTSVGEGGPRSPSDPTGEPDGPDDPGDPDPTREPDAPNSPVGSDPLGVPGGPDGSAGPDGVDPSVSSASRPSEPRHVDPSDPADAGSTGPGGTGGRSPTGPTDAGSRPADAGRPHRIRDPGDESGRVTSVDPDRDWTSPVSIGYGPTPADSDGTPPIYELSTAALLANVAVSQGLFATLLLVGAWVAGVPASAFGLPPGSLTPAAVGVGVGVGLALYVANEVGAALGDRFGLGGSEALRETLAPDSPLGWAALLLVVLPVVAGFEELLFRGALVGAIAVGFGVSPWLMAALSSVAFAVGHGAQGPGGVVVTGVLGFVLAAVFVATGNLLVVVVAHYLVNALEFVVHEWADLDWAT